MNFPRSFLLLICMLISKTSLFAHEDTYISKQKENLYMNFRTSFETFEFKNKCDIFFRLASELIAELNSKEKVFIQIYPYGSYMNESKSTGLGFGDFEFRDIDRRRLISKIEGVGLKLIINNNNFNIQSSLQLLAYGLKNSSDVRRLQKPRYIDLQETLNGKKQFDTLMTIPETAINVGELSENLVVDKLLNKRTYRTLQGLNATNNLDYFYQNGKFHIYNSSYPETKYNPQTGEDDIVKTFGEDLLVVKEITEIRYTRAGDFVFVNDSTFYFFPDERKAFSGPFRLKNVALDRPPVRDLIYEYSENRQARVYLIIDNFSDLTKSLFLPEQRRLINDYQLIEERFISKGESSKKERRETYLFVILLPFLVVSLAFNLLHLFRK